MGTFPPRPDFGRWLARRLIIALLAERDRLIARGVPEKIADAVVRAFDWAARDIAETAVRLASGGAPPPLVIETLGLRMKYLRGLAETRLPSAIATLPLEAQEEAKRVFERYVDFIIKDLCYLAALEIFKAMEDPELAALLASGHALKGGRTALGSPSEA